MVDLSIAMLVYQRVYENLQHWVILDDKGKCWCAYSSTMVFANMGWDLLGYDSNPIDVL